MFKDDRFLRQTDQVKFCARQIKSISSLFLRIFVTWSELAGKQGICVIKPLSTGVVSKEYRAVSRVCFLLYYVRLPVDSDAGDVIIPTRRHSIP